jgi:sirohydrochlorin cobaltochelatase
VRTGLLVVGHGSRREEANETLRSVAGLVAARGLFHAVRPAFLELLSPTIAEGYAGLVADGCDEVVVHPYFLYPGNHSTHDIPAALASCTSVPWRITAPLGVHPALVDVVLDRVREHR